MKTPISKEKENTFKCDKCSALFTQKSSLNRHKNDIHLGLKKYECDYCGTKCSRKKDLENHINIHTNKKPYKCSECPARFNQAAHRRRHEVYLHLGIFNFECDYCKKQFKTKVALKDHIDFHIGEKRYKCILCNKGFPQRSGLSYHKRYKHLDARIRNKYKCLDNCGKAFFSKTDLIRHQAVHKKRQKCKICKKSYLNLKYLDKHEKKCINSFKNRSIILSKCDDYEKKNSVHNKKRQKCKICKKSYLNLKYLDKHEKKCIDSFKNCSIILSRCDNYVKKNVSVIAAINNKNCNSNKKEDKNQIRKGVLDRFCTIC